jgi:UDP-N-acetylglucosamine--N-acetylmuramyl-(pentapeptide) pyrophosphoryl-undecaprenol N-acetylglucosamine transferase
VATTGNPVRPAVRAAARTPYPARRAEDAFRLLVFGGSQGARVFADVAPAAVAALPAEARRRVGVVQQCRGEDVARVTEAYRDAGVAAEVAPFFADLPQRMAASHLVVSRSGASTCAELTVIGRPAILVPLPNALDLDQTANARVIDAAGGGVLLDQGGLTAARLAALLADAMADPARLAAMAAAARGLGKGDAAERLADVVEAVAGAGAGAVADKGVPA